MKPDNMSASVMLGKSLRVKLWEQTGEARTDWCRKLETTRGNADRQEENMWMKWEANMCQVILIGGVGRDKTTTLKPQT